MKEVEPAKGFRPTVKTDVERIKEAPLHCQLLNESPYELTIERAYAHLELKTFSAEREVSENHVQELYDEMALGRFRAEHVNLAVATLSGTDYRVNGQHTCWARVHMPKGYGCEVRLLQYKVPNAEELRKLYSVFDPSYAARTKGHLTKVLLADTMATDGVWTSIISHLSTAFTFWHWPEDPVRRRQGHNEIALAIAQNAELFKKVALFYQAYSTQRHVSRRMGALAALFECFDKRPSLTEDFWKPVTDGLGLSEPQDARYVLREWLLCHTVERRNSNAQNKTTSAEEMYRVCINAWNRWRAGEQIQALRTTARRMKAS